MASTPEGRRLTEEHRQAQQDVVDEFLAGFIALWALLDSSRLDETGPGWVAAVTELVRRFRRRSAAVAVQYFYDFAQAEAPYTVTPPRPGIEIATPGPQTPPPPAGPATGRPPRQAPSPRQSPTAWREPDTQRDADRALERAIEGSGVRFDFDESLFTPRGDREVRIELEMPELDTDRLDRATEVSLIVTGPVSQKSKRGRGKTEQRARDESFVESSGAASRQVLTGGRQSLMRLVQDDMRLVGYIRVTDGDPCYFCAMLASRGPVYRTPGQAGPNRRSLRNQRMPGVAFVGEGGFKVHDHCACTVEPVYRSDTIWPGRAQEFHNLWNQYIRNRYSGDEAIREWRRLYERLQREAGREIA